MDNQTRAEVMKLIADAKRELRKEIWDALNRNHDDKAGIKTDVTDNTDAIIELAEIVGGTD